MNKCKPIIIKILATLLVLSLLGLTTNFVLLAISKMASNVKVEQVSESP